MIEHPASCVMVNCDGGTAESNAEHTNTAIKIERK